jgi:hypothetical protein
MRVIEKHRLERVLSAVSLAAQLLESTDVSLRAIAAAFVQRLCNLDQSLVRTVQQPLCQQLMAYGMDLLQAKRYQEFLLLYQKYSRLYTHALHIDIAKRLMAEQNFELAGLSNPQTPISQPTASRMAGGSLVIGH